MSPYGMGEKSPNYLTNIIMNTITTLDELAEFINSAEEWPLEAFDIIEQNGWNDETGETYGVCSDDTRRIILSDDGQAVVIDK